MGIFMKSGQDSSSESQVAYHMFKKGTLL